MISIIVRFDKHSLVNKLFKLNINVLDTETLNEEATLDHEINENDGDQTTE